MVLNRASHEDSLSNVLEPDAVCLVALLWSFLVHYILTALRTRVKTFDRFRNRRSRRVAEFDKNSESSSSLRVKRILVC
jgi:hypothetical protein